MKASLLTSALAATGLALMASSASASVTTDNHGNVGYDSYDECVAAVRSGSAHFYTPYTHEEPQLGRGEVSIRKATLSDVMIPQNMIDNMPLRTRDYNAGSCDLGVGHSNGRSGVSAALVGKYVPFSPDMPVNVYMNASGEPVRVTMQQCDNHFSSRFPIPVISEAPAPEPQLRIDEQVSTRVLETTVNRRVQRIQPVPVVRPVVVQPSGAYEVQEVIVAPRSQVHRVNTPQGTQVVIQNAPNQAVAVGTVVDPATLKEVREPAEVPVIRVPPINNSNRVSPPR